jgi:MarR family 2-MHQ and catechol resistance regulon transcriptional repressor
MSKANRINAPSLWLVLAKAYGAMAAYAERSVTAQGLCLSDFMVLEALLHKGPLTISAIGEKVLLASASMTSAIDRLETRALVQRESSSADRRLRIVALTREGKDLIDKLYAQHEQDLEVITAEFSGAERRDLYDGLKKLGLAATHAAHPESSKQAELHQKPRKPTKH